MATISFENLPNAVGQMAQRLERMENILIENHPPPQQPVKKKYTLPEAANYCGMAEPTFRTYIYRRKVAGTKFGKAWLFLQSDLDKFIADYRRPTAQELESAAYENLTSNKKGGKK